MSRDLKNKLKEIYDMACSLYPEGEDGDSDINGGPKDVNGKPMESDAPGNDFGDKVMKKKMLSKMIAKRMNGYEG